MMRRLIAPAKVAATMLLAFSLVGCVRAMRGQRISLWSTNR